MSVAGRAFQALMLVFLLAMIAGAILGQPILLGYVETGSMEPTLSPGDGFVAVPSALTDIEQGDVITFRAEEIQSGGLTTHRVVGQTADGFVTRGDANPFTDQDGEEPPVKREQIVAEVFQVGGNVVVVPNLGTGVEVVQDVLTLVQTWIAELIGFQTFLGTKGLAYLFFAFTVIYYVAGEYRDRNARDDEQRSRSRDTGLDPRLVLGAFAAILVLGATATMAGPAGPRQFGTVSAEFQSDRPDVIPMGESKNRTYRVPNSGLVPTVVFLEPGSDQVEIAPHEHHLGPRTTANATLTLHAPPDTGYYRYYVTEHRYLAVLPTSTIRTLYGMHPWLPVVVIDALIAGAFLALTLPFVGSGRIRDRSRDGAHRSILTRLVR